MAPGGRGSTMESIKKEEKWNKRHFAAGMKRTGPREPSPLCLFCLKWSGKAQ